MRTSLNVMFNKTCWQYFFYFFLPPHPCVESNVSTSYWLTIFFPVILSYQRLGIGLDLCSNIFAEYEWNVSGNFTNEPSHKSNTHLRNNILKRRTYDTSG